MCRFLVHVFDHSQAKERDSWAILPGPSIALRPTEMKAATRLQLSPRARATRLTLLLTMLAVWCVVVLALVPRDRKIPPPHGDRTSPALPYSIPAAPVRV